MATKGSVLKAKVIHEMSTDEVTERIENERKMVIKLRMNHAVSPLENPKKITYTRKTLARLLTEQRKRQIGEAAKLKKN